jgi:peptidyl-prolyl cis-trans isomerase SurA
MPQRIPLFLLALALLQAAVPLKQSRADVVDKILVIVNDEIITQSDLDRVLAPIYLQYKNLYSGEELAERFGEARRNVLQKLISDKLFLDEAKKKKIEVTDAQIEEKMSEVMGRFDTPEEFKKALEREHVALGDLEEKYRERLMIDRLIAEEIYQKTSVSPSEIVAYYTENKQDFKQPERVKVRSILIKVSEARPEEKALLLAREMLYRLEEGGDFTLLATEYSDGPYALSGGDMGWVKKGELMERINNLVFGLKAGEISGILTTKLGYHIFKVEAKEEATDLEFAQVKDAIEKMLFNKKVKEQIARWIEDLKEDAYIAFR